MTISEKQITIYYSDCFDIFPILEPRCIDLVLCDMPYGITQCKWDSLIDLDKMWIELKRICKQKCVYAFTGSQPFTTTLINSNRKWFKYCWVWQKTCGVGFINSHNRPIKYHEDIVIFSPASAAIGGDNMTYNPQNLIPFNQLMKNRIDRNRSETMNSKKSSAYGSEYIQQFSNYPTTIIKFKNDATKMHPTQKPLALMEYLIKTYSNEGNMVLDFCMGSGTTGVACINTNRRFIGIEKEKKYFDIAERRLNE